MKWRRRAVLILLYIFVAFIVPHYVIPTLSSVAGVGVFNGLHGVKIGVGIAVLPVPIFITPDSYTFVGFFISGAAAILYLLYRDGVRLRRMLRKQIAPLLTLTSSYTRTGMPVLDALHEAGKALGEPLYSYVARFVELVKLGYDPEKSFEECLSTLPRDVRAPLAAISVAISSGGRVVDTLSAAEEYVLHMTRLEELRRSRLEGYKVVLILAVVAFTISAVLSLTIVSYISRTLNLYGLMGRSFSIPLISTMYYIPSMFIVITSSIAISRIVYGETAVALKYISILSPIVSIVFAVAVSFL